MNIIISDFMLKWRVGAKMSRKKIKKFLELCFQESPLSYFLATLISSYIQSFVVYCLSCFHLSVYVLYHRYFHFFFSFAAYLPISQFFPLLFIYLLSIPDLWSHWCVTLFFNFQLQTESRNHWRHPTNRRVWFVQFSVLENIVQGIFWFFSC